MIAIIGIANIPLPIRGIAYAGVACALFHAGCNCEVSLTHTIFIPAFVLNTRTYAE